MKRLLLLLLLAGCGQAHADAEFGVGHAANIVNTSLHDCSGQCNFSHGDSQQTPLTLILSGYYTGLPVDIGAELYFPGDPSLAAMLRKRVGSMLFAVGAGVSRTEVSLDRGDNTQVGDGQMSAADVRPFYLATFRYGIGDGAIVASYARSTGDMNFNGFMVTGFTVVNGSNAPTISDTSANIDVERAYARIGYEFRF